MRALVLSSFLMLTSPAIALAQAPVPSEAANAEADELTHRGVDLLKAHRYPEAYALFQRAITLKRSYDIIGNLGLAEAGVERWRDAAEHLSGAIATFPANGKVAHRDLLAEKLAIARKRVGALTVQVDVRGADVLVDGKVVATSPVPGELFVDPGAHVVEARLAGRSSARSDANVTAGSAATVALSLPEGPGATPLNRGPRVALAVTSGVLAVIGLAAGAGLAVASNSKASSAASLRTSLGGGVSACTGGGSASCQMLGSDLGAQASLARGSAASFILGGAFAAAAIGFGAWAGTATAVQLGATGRGVRLEGTW